MRHRLKKSQRCESVSSNRSGTLPNESRDSPPTRADAAHSRTLSAPVPALSPDASALSLSQSHALPQPDISAQAMGINSRNQSNHPERTSNRGASTEPPSPAPAMTSSATAPLPTTSSSPHDGDSHRANFSRKLSTIRTVTSVDDRPALRPSLDDEGSSVDSPSVTRHSNSALSSSVNSNTSAASCISQNFSPQIIDAKASSQPPSSQGAIASTQPNVTSALLEVPGVYRGSSTPVQAAGTLNRSVETPSKDSSLTSSGGPISLNGLSGPNVSVERKGSVGFGIPSGRNIARAAFTVSAVSGTTTNGDSGSGGMADDSVSSGGNGAWDATVGKAGLGKTGRVINRLVSDNEALKREIKIEGLKADEAKQAARLLEDKMERLVSDYESRLLEANVTKTLLARKERQVESLQGAVDLEKKRTADAQERERNWRAEMDKVRNDSKRQVEEAVTHASLMEGRYNAISSHWRDQGEEVRRAADRMGKEVKELVAARREDDEKINTLRDLCDQQDSNIKMLREQKEAIACQFEEYKAEQERILHGLKTHGAAREAEQAQMLTEAREVLDKLKWALNIKEKVKWAQ